MELRITGTETECKALIDKLKTIASVDTNDKFYLNRGSSTEGRVYVNNVILK